MKWLFIALGLLVALTVIGIVYVRSASHDPARWHVDPATVTEVTTRNQSLGTQTFNVPRYRVVETLDIILRSMSGVLSRNNERLAGNLDTDFATYVFRTPLAGFPDYVSARVDEIDGDTRVSLYSRSRFGHSDLGANSERIDLIFRSLEGNFTGS